MFKLLALLVCFVAITLAQTAPQITVKNMRLFRGEDEFFIKGVSYNPTPLGLNANNSKAGGYCSILETVYGEFLSACHDSDYADGQIAPKDREPIGSAPTGPWFKALWDRDFPLMQEVGVNTIRLYNANPITAAAAKSKPQIWKPFGANHIPFFDMAAEHNMMIIFPLIGDENILRNNNDSYLRQLLRYQIDEIGNHPALLMYTFGNELPIYTDSKLLGIINTYLPYIRQYQAQKWNRTIPVTNCIVDNPPAYDFLYENLDVDVFCSNAGYRGTTFTDLFTGNTRQNFSGIATLGCKYDKPLLIGEMGAHSINNSLSQTTPNWINQQWQSVVNATGYGLIGTVFFEFNDEPSKNDPEQETMGMVAVSVNTQGSRNSLQPNVFLTDNISIKTVFIQAKNGTVGGKPFNFNANIFELMGRNPARIDGTNQVCNPVSGSTSGVQDGSTAGPSNTYVPTYTPKPATGSTYQASSTGGVDVDSSATTTDTSTTSSPSTTRQASTSSTGTTSSTSNNGGSSSAVSATVTFGSLLAVVLLF